MHNCFVKINKNALTIIFIFFNHFPVKAQIEAISIRYAIIPFPAHLVTANGGFVINKNTSLVVQNESFRPDAIALKQLIKRSGESCCMNLKRLTKIVSF